MFPSKPSEPCFARSAGPSLSPRTPTPSWERSACSPDSADPERPEWMTLPAQLPEGWGLEGGQGSRSQASLQGRLPTPPPRPTREPQPTSSAGSGAGLGSRSQQHLNLKWFPLFSSSQTLPRSLREESHQKNINLLTWGPTASLSRIPKPQAFAVSAPAHPNCSLGARFPALWTLSRALRLQGLDSAPSGEVEPWVCRGEGGRQADAKTEDLREAEANPTALLLLLLQKPLLLLPVTMPHPKDRWPWSLTSFHFRE